MRNEARPACRRKRTAVSPASSGVAPNTPECIFTPVGIPSRGVWSPMTDAMSRAVPSPPANRIKSTAASRMARAAACVSSRVVGPAPISPTVAASRPSDRTASAPISPAAAQIRTSGREHGRRNPRRARFPAMGTAPNAAARRWAPPSVPCNPTAPPMPAMGLMITPSFLPIPPG